MQLSHKWNIAQQTARMQIAADITYMALRWLVPENFIDEQENSQVFSEKLKECRDTATICIEQAIRLRVYPQSKAMTKRLHEHFFSLSKQIRGMADDPERQTFHVLALHECANVAQCDVINCCSDLDTKNWVKLFYLQRELCDNYLYPAFPDAELVGFTWYYIDAFEFKKNK